jgi:hypothetical protein
MAVITSLGISSNSDDTRFAVSNISNPISSNNNDTRAAFENTQNLTQIYANPLFINAYCPAVGPTRPTTGQVYPRGYN